MNNIYKFIKFLQHGVQRRPWYFVRLRHRASRVVAALDGRHHRHQRAYGKQGWLSIFSALYFMYSRRHSADSCFCVRNMSRFANYAVPSGNS